MKKTLTSLLVAAIAHTAAPVHAGTLEDVKARGNLLCSSTTGSPGFSMPDDAGKRHGLEVDVCRAIATAVFGDPERHKIVVLNPTQRFTALQSGEVDILFNTTTWTLSREGAGALYAGVTYYDGQGVLVRKGAIASAKELDGGAICTNQGSTTELNLVDFFRANKVSNEVITFATVQEAANAYESGRCDAWSADAGILAALRSKMKAPDDHVILADRLSKEPLGAAVRKGDDAWFSVVRWSIFALQAAEELGLTSKNIAEQAKSTTNPEVLRFVGKEGSLGKVLGLNGDWAYQIVAQVGSYAEIFDRNIGAASPLNLERGINASWKNGGLFYTPPFR
ncbi:amino acid ABC transporter substrate-binding protein [Bordetella bronchiseptica]|uniref:amino acid ABC transporter substrate-binding protein n=1 Tax=Bordetella bronchiseptica TaxID=518 RepID=UPI00029056A0|nr:amino acid ABC transporter substrate-binding protein [Bordetella bronchiseptica]KAB1444894.1 amino acid ABC transporter substrate-binding protein [Bordetella bronchiseptica]KAB1571114.1 amino acid ABC transporter substrate-binding protein [Bordetella bronchiseptica]KDB59168.1 putative general L-amino acid-binding periplasmic protein AapJ [Bordetella bronchiseptica B18-5 (C3)]KDC43360.1 putative general L-amino acid-binding periplasmic protein AapJ [Bordetella bronchiseptica M85/00/2]KDC6254